MTADVLSVALALEVQRVERERQDPCLVELRFHVGSRV